MMAGRCRIGQVAAGILVGFVPATADAELQVPAIQATATASVSTVLPGSTDHPAPAGPPQTNAGTLPSVMPPAIPLISSDVTSLNGKERAAIALSHHWATRNEMPRAGEDGYVRFLFGAALPTVVCAPLQICNLALQPGEVVNNVNLGDSVRWKVTPSISGAGGAQTTHLIIKPTDAGLLSSLDIETNRRTYAVKLISTGSSWMPLVAFNYPDDAPAQWQGYQQNVAFGAAATTLSSGETVANLQFLCISGSRPSWSPIRAYTDGAKTYIEFSSAISFQAAPALVALANDGSWLTKPSAQIVNYRVLGNRYVVDAALDRAALISGVGGDQEKVIVSRGKDCR